MRLRKELIVLFILQNASKCSSYVQSTTIHSLRGFPTTAIHQPRHLRLPSLCKGRISSYQRCSFINTHVISPPVSSILFSSYEKKTIKKVRGVTLAGSTVSHNNGNDGRPFLQRVVDMFRNFISSLLVSKTLEV